MFDDATPRGADGDTTVPVEALAAARPEVTVALAVALFALSALDLAVTEIGILRYGAVEMNPLMATVIGTPWALVIKLGLPAIIVLLAYKVYTPLAIRALRIAVAVYIVVVIFNLTQFAIVVAA